LLVDVAGLHLGRREEIDGDFTMRELAERDVGADREPLAFLECPGCGQVFDRGAMPKIEPHALVYQTPRRAVAR
jgi:hypothetical protein